MADKKDNDRRLNYLEDLSKYKMADNDPDVRGWEVFDADNEPVGKVSGLLVDKEKEKVRYLDVDLNDDLLSEQHDPFDVKHEDGIHEFSDKEGEIHMIIPVGVARVERDHKKVVADGIDRDSLRNIPSYRYRKDIPVHPKYERRVVQACMGGTKRKEVELELSDDEIYNSEQFNQDRFYGRSSKQ